MKTSNGDADFFPGNRVSATFISLHTEGFAMAILFCIRKDVFLLPDRRGVLFELLRNFIRSAGRFFPELTFENCQWRSTLADCAELDAVLGMPQGAGAEKFKDVWQVFLQFLLECAKQGNRIKAKGRTLELAVGQWRQETVHLVLSPQRRLSFGSREVLALIRGETIYPEWDVVEGQHVRRFQGLACFLTPAEVKEQTAQCAELHREKNPMPVTDIPVV